MGVIGIAMGIPGSARAAASAVAPANTVAPVVSGSAPVGASLACTTGTWTGTAPITYAYQWTRDGSNIAAATSSTYTTVSADVGHAVGCTVTATNAGGSASAASSTTVTVTQAPANTVAPAVTGSATVGNALSSTTGTWTGSPSPSFSYQWRRDAVDIGGATSSSYTTVAADVGHAVTCVVTATNSAGSASASSNATTVAGIAPANTASPVVSGSVIAGSVLSTTDGTWTGTPSPTFTYQWKSDGANITGQTSSTYTTVSGDSTHTIACAVTATNAAGSASANSSGEVIVSATGLALWLRSDSLSPGAVASWPDLSASAATCTQSDATKQPTCSASGGLNGQPRVTFDGARALQCPLGFANLSAAWTIAIVAKLASEPHSGFSPFSLKSASGSLFTELLLDLATYKYESWVAEVGNSTRAGVGYDVALGTSAGHVLLETYNTGSQSATTSYTASLDGAGETILTSGNFLRTSSDLGSIGGRLTSGNAVSFGLVGDLYEVVAYTRVLTSGEQAALVSYLRARYGL